jgi:hypothetical protein
MEDFQPWFLLKHNDSNVFGPITLEQLQCWSDQAQISPLDRVSNNGNIWMRAPMLEELGMDYILEVAPNQFYGPTALGAIREFLAMGEISEETRVTNCCTGKESSVGDLTGSTISHKEVAPPPRASIRMNLQQRIRELEETLMVERRSREIAEHLVAKLETQLSEIKENTASKVL